jgi:hypothetical protein
MLTVTVEYMDTKILTNDNKVSQIINSTRAATIINHSPVTVIPGRHNTFNTVKFLKLEKKDFDAELERASKSKTPVTQ